MPLGHRAIVNRLKERLPRLRQRLNLTQEETAFRAGITSRYYQGLENGTSKNPTVKVLAGLAKAFDLEVWQLLDFGTDELLED